MVEGPICCDTSFLFSLYANNVHTASALRIVRKLDRPFTLSKFNEFELANALRLAEFRKILNSGKAAMLLAEFEADVLDCRHVIAPCNLAEIVDEAKRLSSRFTLSEGYRAFDILHVATAVHLSACRFFTFDENQRALAGAEGLKTN